MSDHAVAHRWDDPDHAKDYLANRQEVPHRTEGEATLVEALGPRVERVLDLGAGDGRVLATVLAAHPGAGGVALDHNPAMLDTARSRFAGETDVTVVDHDLSIALPSSLGTFDAVVSALAIHHFDEERRTALYREIAALLRPGGVFADLDLVCSTTEALHDRFAEQTPWGRNPDVAWDRHPTLTQRLDWVAGAGFTDVDCLWKWREMALVVGATAGA